MHGCVLREIQCRVCSALHQMFIADTNIAKLVHFQVRQSDRQTSRELDRLIIRQTDRGLDRPINQAGRWADRRTGRQTNNNH